MIIIENTLEMRGMRRREIINYFDSINGENTGFGKFTWQDCKVEVSEESIITIGTLEIPSTKVLFYGEKERIEQMIIAFRLKFLCAGG
jgi:hypothetical protein